MEDNYSKAYKEVMEVLNFVPKESVDKIPQTIIDTFKAKMDNEYDFKVDINKSFEEQDLLEETKAIFANIFRDYWATPYQKEKIEAKEKYDRKKAEEEKREEYNPDDIFKKKQSENEIENIKNYSENLPSEVKKEKFYEKIINFFKRIFKCILKELSMEETIDKKIERLLDDEKIKEIIATAGKGEVAPVTRASNLIGEVYTYCFVHNDGEEIDPDSLKVYLERMSNAYFECRGSEDLMQDIRARELGKSIAQRLNIDLSQGSISREDEIQIQEYFLKNYVENGYVMHSFPGAAEQSIRTYGFSSSERIWDNKEIMEIAHIFEEKNVIAPVGAYSHYSGGGMYVENNPRQMYRHGLSAPEWFKWFTSANHNRNSSEIDESPYYLRDYDGCKQNVMDLCNNAELNEEEMQKVMEMFEKNWKLLGTERMCVSLIPKSVIGKANIEDAIIPGQSAIETIKTVLTDGRKQFKEHEGNVLKTTVTEKDMLIMGLPNASEIFGEHEFSRESKKKLYYPKQVLDLIFRGTKESGFELNQDKINSIIETLREVHNNSPEVEDIIQQYNQRVALFSEQEIMYKKENKNHVLQNVLSLLESYMDEKNGQVSAIPYGIPSSAFSGIVVGDYLLQNEQYMRTIQQLFPDCYILNHEGKVYFDPSLSKEENESKKDECMENLQQFKSNLIELGDRAINRFLENAPKSTREWLDIIQQEYSKKLNAYSPEDIGKALKVLERHEPAELVALEYSEDLTDFAGTQLRTSTPESVYAKKMSTKHPKNMLDLEALKDKVDFSKIKEMEQYHSTRQVVEPDIRQSNNPQYLYHHTRVADLESILATGLEIRNGVQSQAVKDQKTKVFFSEGMEGAIAMASAFQHKFDYMKKGTEWEDKTLEDFLDERVFLRFSSEGVENESDKGDFAFADGWTSKGILPEQLKVCLLKNIRTGEISYQRDDILKYMLSVNPIENFKGGDERHKKDIKRYYEERSEELSEFDISEYALEEMELDKFFEQYISKRKEPIAQSTNLSKESLYLPQEIGKATINTPIQNKDNAMLRVQIRTSTKNKTTQEKSLKKR